MAIEMTPEADSFAARGFLLKQMGQREKAADDMGEAIRREPSKATFHLHRGDLLLELGREEAALADYDEAVRLAPDKAELCFSRGVCRLIVGREGGGDDFRALLRLKGWRHETSATCILLGYAADLLAGRPAEARAFLEQALARCDPGSWPHPMLRCLHGDLAEANALAAAPGDEERTYARLCLGIKRIAEGRRDAGLRDLREVCNQGDAPVLAIDVARAVLRREGRDLPAKPK